MERPGARVEQSEHLLGREMDTTLLQVQERVPSLSFPCANKKHSFLLPSTDRAESGKKRALPICHLDSAGKLE